MDYPKDEDEAGARRQAHALVSRWARLCEEATGNEPTRWLVVRLTTIHIPGPRRTGISCPRADPSEEQHCP